MKPAKGGGGATAQERNSDVTRADGSRPSILVVDDEAMIRAILQRALRRVYDVTAVEGPQEALEAMAARRFDLVMTDINMPGGSGLDLAATIQAQVPPTPVAILSAVVDEDTHDRIEALAAPLFFKPFDIPELMTMLEALFKSLP